MLEGYVTDSAKNLSCIINATSLAQPSWRFRLEEHEDDEESTWNQLEAEGELPLLVVGGPVLVDSIVDPEANDKEGLEHDLEDTDESSSKRWWCTFRNVEWNDERGASNTKSSEYSSTVYHS